jgi:hypothetical protein
VAHFDVLLLLDGMHGGILGTHVSVHMLMHNAHATQDCGRQRARMLACLSYAPPVRDALYVAISLCSYPIAYLSAHIMWALLQLPVAQGLSLNRKRLWTFAAPA